MINPLHGLKYCKAHQFNDFIRDNDGYIYLTATGIYHNWHFLDEKKAIARIKGNEITVFKGDIYKKIQVNKDYAGIKKTVNRYYSIDGHKLSQEYYRSMYEFYRGDVLYLWSNQAIDTGKKEYRINERNTIVK